jgi:hypothetical protein
MNALPLFAKRVSSINNLDYLAKSQSVRTITSSQRNAIKIKQLKEKLISNEHFKSTQALSSSLNNSFSAKLKHNTEKELHALKMFVLSRTKGVLQTRLNKVEVRASSIHGNGVFALQKLHADEIATFYP